MTQRDLKYLVGIDRQRVWLTMAELAVHGKFSTAEAARKFLSRHPDLPRAKRGRVLLVDRDVFDRFVSERSPSRKQQIA